MTAWTFLNRWVARLTTNDLQAIGDLDTRQLRDIGLPAAGEAIASGTVFDPKYRQPFQQALWPHCLQA